MRVILQRVRQGRAQLDAILMQVDDAHMDSEVTEGGWAVRDVMAHITYWEGWALARFQEAARGEAVDQINAEAQAAGRQLSFAQVRAEYAAVHQGLLEAIDAMPEDPADPWWALWPEWEPAWVTIGNNTWGHYDEHLPDLRHWQAHAGT